MGDDEVLVKGKQVEYIFFPGEPLVVSHAEYHFENKTPAAKTCSVVECSFIENERNTRLDSFYIYAGDQLLDKLITIAPGANLDVRITFPFREVNLGVNFRYGVKLTVECDGKRYEVVSDLNIIRERSIEE